MHYNKVVYWILIVIDVNKKLVLSRYQPLLQQLNCEIKLYWQKTELSSSIFWLLQKLNIKSEAQVKEERAKRGMGNEEDSSNRVLDRSENKKLLQQKRKSLFLIKLEENISSLQDAVKLDFEQTKK